MCLRVLDPFFAALLWILVQLPLWQTVHQELQQTQTNSASCATHTSGMLFSRTSPCTNWPQTPLGAYSCSLELTPHCGNRSVLPFSTVWTAPRYTSPSLLSEDSTLEIRWSVTLHTSGSQFGISPTFPIALPFSVLLPWICTPKKQYSWTLVSGYAFWGT